MTKSKALKILNEYYQKNGNITLYYLYDWYEKEFDYYNDLVTNRNCNKSTEDYYCGIITLELVINSLKEETTNITDTLLPELLIKPGYVTFNKIARSLQMGTFKCNQYDITNCWLPLYIKESKKKHDEFYNCHIEKIKINLQERFKDFNRITGKIQSIVAPYRKINPNI